LHCIEILGEKASAERKESEKKDRFHKVPPLVLSVLNLFLIRFFVRFVLVNQSHVPPILAGEEQHGTGLGLFQVCMVRSDLKKLLICPTQIL